MNHFESLHAAGLQLFPINLGSKVPAHEGWQQEHYSPEQLNGGNAGIHCTGLIAVDVDNKNGKDGSLTLDMLQLEHSALPETLTQTTPSGGLHYIFRIPADSPQLQNSVGRIGSGLDIRTHGGFVVAAGSQVEKGTYGSNGKSIVPAPMWLVELCKRRSIEVNTEEVLVDQDEAREESIKYARAYPAPSGGTRNDQLFKLACHIKNVGVADPADAYDIIHTMWACRGDEPCDDTPDRNLQTVVNAYNNSNGAVGSASKSGAVEVAKGAFASVIQAKPASTTATKSTKSTTASPTAAPEPEMPTNSDQLKNDYCVVKIGSSGILMNNHTGQMISWESAERLLSPEYGVAAVKLFQSSYNYRAFPGGLTFNPTNEDTYPQYNTWKGFAATPDSTHSAAVDRWVANIYENACRGDSELAAWLLDWIAAIFQQPERKPGVAIVLQGRKGVGKNRLIEPLIKILGRHGILADDSRYLTGNFNSHLQSNLLLTLDEAFWSGDKSAEGKLKGIITGASHIIEQKGFEPYAVPNLSRIAILGNESWLVPASHDERRFAVFQFASTHQQNRDWFSPIGQHRFDAVPEQMNRLLGMLKSHEIKSNIEVAPVTPALIAQKISSLSIELAFWHDLLATLDTGGFAREGFFGLTVPVGIVYNMFQGYAKRRNVKWTSALPELFDALCPASRSMKVNALTTVDVPDIITARNDFDAFIGGKLTWPSNELNLL